jgi:hypothetical protein
LLSHFRQAREKSELSDLRSFQYFRAHPVQRLAWTEPKRFKIIPAGRRSGKTHMAIVHTIRDALVPRPWPDPRFALSAPTRPQAHLIYWERLLSMTPDWLIKSISYSSLRVNLINGASIHVVGMDAPQRIEGVAWDGFVLDEFGNMKPAAWFNHVRPALADRTGWAWLIGVPEGRNHYFEVWQHAQMDPDWGAYTWKSEDILPAEEIEELKRSLDPKTYRREMEASFEEDSGRVYYAFDRNRDVHEFPLEPHAGTDGLPWYGGMDFNVSPMTSVWGWERDIDGRSHVFVWDEYCADNSSTWEAAKQVKERVASYDQSPRFGRFIMHPDPTGSQRRSSAQVGITDHRILGQAGFRVSSRLASPALRDKWNAVNAKFENAAGERSMHIHPRCRRLIRDLEGVIYKPGTSEPDPKCADSLHITDALGYWIEKRHRLAAKAGGLNLR